MNERTVSLRRVRNAGPTWFLWALLGAALAAPLPAARGQLDPQQDPVAARVNDRVIRASEVERELRVALQGLDVTREAMPRLRVETLDKLIDRQLVLAYLDQHKLAATQADVDLAWHRLRDELKGRGRTMDDYMRQLGQTEDQLRESMRWTLSWKNYLDRFLTDANVEKYFQSHQREFDGTELRVAHVLLKVERPEAAPQVVAEAEKLRQQIVDKQLTFADAAREHSSAPTAAEGGDIGWIMRHEPMPESFSRAAFATAVGGVSPPVTTPFGVHLITCLEERPGQKTWKTERGALEKAMAAYLFSWSADQQRGMAQIERFPGALNPTEGDGR